METVSLKENRRANQDKGSSRDIQVILDEFSFYLVARKEVELNQVTVEIYSLQLG